MMNKRSFNAAMAAGLLGGSVFAGSAWAQAFPSKPLRVVVPQPPGGGFDVVGRLLADRLGKALGQTAVVENRPGSGTLVGTDLVAKAPADGYTLLVGSVSNLALNPGLYPNIPYDSLRDFEPVGLAVAYSYTLVARKDLPFSNLRELIAHAKANPKKLTYASGGSGSGCGLLMRVRNICVLSCFGTPGRASARVPATTMRPSACCSAVAGYSSNAPGRSGKRSRLP